MKLILLFALYVSSCFAQEQESDLCPFHFETLKKLMLSQNKECSSALNESNQAILKAVETVQSFNQTLNVLLTKMAELPETIKCSVWKSQYMDKLPLKNLQTGKYVYVEKHGNWTVASQACKRHGLKLVTFSSEEELNLVSGAAPKFWYWVGATDIDRTPGQFYWTDGRKVEDSWWDKTEPNKFGAEKKTCVCLKAKSAKLHDCNCSQRMEGFICQIDDQFANC